MNKFSYKPQNELLRSEVKDLTYNIIAQRELFINWLIDNI